MKNKTWMRNTAKKGILAGLLLAVCVCDDSQKAEELLSESFQ